MIASYVLNRLAAEVDGKAQNSLDNSYLPVSSEVLEAEEYGLEGRTTTMRTSPPDGRRRLQLSDVAHV